MDYSQGYAEAPLALQYMEIYMPYPVHEIDTPFLRKSRYSLNRITAGRSYSTKCMQGESTNVKPSEFRMASIDFLALFFFTSAYTRRYTSLSRVRAPECVHSKNVHFSPYNSIGDLAEVLIILY